MKKVLKKIPKRILPYIVFILSALILAYCIFLRVGASSKGGSMGQDLGSKVGNAIGSFEGFTKGRSEGEEAGKSAGLSADDTAAEIANEIHKVENLEVLVASVKVTDMHSIGQDNEYAALYLVKGEAVFSVDLASAKIEFQNDTIHITLPRPKVELHFDQSQIDKAAEYQKYYFSGSAEDGFDAYLNTMTKLKETTADELDNYDELLDEAKESAKKQVAQLATSANMRKRNVYIEFEEEQENE